LILKINDYQNFSGDMTLRCLIGYSEEFAELKKPYYGLFADLVVFATKAFIFKNLSLEVDMAKLSGGREFGRYKEFIDDYRDANEQYQTLLEEKFTKILLLNDQNRKDRHLLRAGLVLFIGISIIIDELFVSTELTTTGEFRHINF
jgi:hypothetical protein